MSVFLLTNYLASFLASRAPGDIQTVGATSGNSYTSSFQHNVTRIYAHEVSLTLSLITGPVAYVTDATGSMNKSQRRESPRTSFETGLDCSRRLAKDFLERETHTQQPRLGDTPPRFRCARARVCASV